MLQFEINPITIKIDGAKSLNDNVIFSTIYNPRYNLILYSEYYNCKETYKFINIKFYPEIKMVLFFSMYDISIDHISTILDNNIKTIIRDIMNLSDDYIISNSKDIFYLRREELKKNIIYNINKKINNINLSEKIFYEYIFSDIKCFNDNINVRVLNADDLLDLNEFDNIKVNKFVEDEFLSYIHRLHNKIKLDYQWKTYYNKTYIETYINFIDKN